MGYSICYGAPTRQEKKRKNIRLKRYFAAALIIAVIIARLIFPQTGEYVRRILLPGMDDHAIAAFSEMMDQLRQGEDFMQAAEVFCREIIDHAQSKPAS